MKPILVTYPRSGQHYLTDLIKQKLNFDIEYTHDLIIKGYDKYITIIRDPIESITSWVVMEIECGPLDGSKEYPMDVYIDQAIKEYIIFYTYLLKQVDFIIKYKTLIEDPEKVIMLISNIFKIKLNNIKYLSTIKDNRPGRFIKTSTSSPLYKDVIKKVSNYNLDRCYSLYQNAIEKSNV